MAASCPALPPPSAPPGRHTAAGPRPVAGIVVDPLIALPSAVWWVP